MLLLRDKRSRSSQISLPRVDCSHYCSCRRYSTKNCESLVWTLFMASCNFNVAPKLFFSAQNRKNRKKTSKTEPKPDKSF
jgi:hypothetical protein